MVSVLSKVVFDIEFTLKFQNLRHIIQRIEARPAIMKRWLAVYIVCTPLYPCPIVDIDNLFSDLEAISMF